MGYGALITGAVRIGIVEVSDVVDGESDLSSPFIRQYRSGKGLFEVKVEDWPIDTEIRVRIVCVGFHGRRIIPPLVELPKRVELLIDPVRLQELLVDSTRHSRNFRY